jgi:DNA repair exonuclease SbcCD nuclease subunit
MQFCFVHAADLHLDTPFEGVGEISPDLAARLRDASLEALDNLVRLTIAKRAAFLLLAGDIYDGADRGIRAQFRFLQAMKALHEAGIPVFIVHGNHDPLDGWTAIRQWPPNVTVFPSDRVESKPVLRDGRTIATIYGISYPTRDVSANLAVLFERKPAEGLHIGLLHCNLGGVPEHGRYAPCTPADLARADMHYWALGHIHTRRAFQAESSWVVYPGNTQGRGFKLSEQGPKGAMVVTAGLDGIHELQFEPLDCVRFAEVTVNIAAAQDWGALADALETQAREANLRTDNRGLVLRATLHGRGPLHADLSQPGRIDELLREMRSRCIEDLANVYWTAIAVRTSPDFDRESMRDRGDFAAELVQRTDALLNDEPAQAAFAGLAWTHPKSPQLAKWLPEPDAAERAELLRLSERRALEQILECLEQEADS